MNKHTPAPWTAHDDDGTGTLPCVLSDKVNKGGNYYVAQCNNYEDACLIAAAPELLEALIALERAATKTEMSPDMFVGQTANDLSIAIASAREAIAKAEDPDGILAQWMDALKDAIDEPLCSCCDPVHPDDPNCPVHKEST